MHIIVLRQSSQKSLRECVIGNSIRIPYTIGRFSKRRETPKPKMIPHPTYKVTKECFLSCARPRFFMMSEVFDSLTVALQVKSVLRIPPQMQPPINAVYGTDTI